MSSSIHRPVDVANYLSFDAALRFPRQMRSMAAAPGPGRLQCRVLLFFSMATCTIMPAHSPGCPAPSRRKRQPKGKGKGKEEKDVKDERDVAAMPASPSNSPLPDPDNTNHENGTEETKPDANDKASNRRLERADKDASFLESFSPHTDWYARVIRR
ncbi:hypothetical protein B0H14DRAFT_2563299 [Mycena olivaceomarginata]|nr:hypothetical protein B0H14DRAFT_2563299 [Mycena olivaceomarginata]